ncbi:hypothetical protein [Mesorhizobium sangaii]|uniref:Uncharacterized protein n=1 Tax=Mesorhizobium sangaii TaxID=505389 RepID=A0A841PLI1_9HYPH|nr:hypothetical protein [Mesorhizobium sangaii]MBB6411550.1 hypothetical protein [Mesorhizobium sangaii]
MADQRPIGFGFGDKADTIGPWLKPGSFFVLQPGGKHYVWTGDEGGVIDVQVSSPGGITFVNPADAPTKKYLLLGVERETDKPAFALMAERGTGRYVGSAFITLNREMRERLGSRVQDHAGMTPKGMKHRRRSGSSRA